MFLGMKYGRIRHRASPLNGTYCNQGCHRATRFLLCPAQGRCTDSGVGAVYYEDALYLLTRLLFFRVHRTLTSLLTQYLSISAFGKRPLLEKSVQGKMMLSCLQCY